MQGEAFKEVGNMKIPPWETDKGFSLIIFLRLLLYYNNDNDELLNI